MKNASLKIGSIMLSLGFLTGGLTACNLGKKEAVNCTVEGVNFDYVNETQDIESYASAVYSNGANYDGPLEDGVIVSPYYTLTVGGKEIPVYATRCARNPHSFAYVEVDKTNEGKGFEVEVTLTATTESKQLTKKNASVVVLPEKRGVETTLADGKVSARISDFGSFTFAFNKAPEEGLTLYLAQKQEFKVEEGWDVQYIEPQKHTMADTTFKNSETVYYFKKGRHLVDAISIPSNAWVYLESGAYLEVYADGEGQYKSVFSSYGTENIKLSGHGIVDFSASMGGDEKKKGTFDFQNIDTAVVDGIISINSNTWTLCFTNCENVHISRAMLFGYRTYSDGIMLSDCRNAEVTKCFVRTGDDAMETKSTSSGGHTDGVVYRDNDCWTDKGLGYGVVWETNQDVQNVTFIDCSVGFALSDWNDRLGALAIQLGDRYNTVENIRFENIEIYRCYSHAVINCELKLQGKLIDKVYIKNVHCKYATGYLFRLAEVDLQNTPARFGDFYLDNVSKNGVTLTESTKNDEYMCQYIIGTSGWSADKYVHINTLQNDAE